MERVFNHFALIAVAGELATLYGITRWESGEAQLGVMKCFRDWLTARGGTGEIYIPWFKYFLDEIQCLYAQLPGRGKRFHEKSFDQLSPLIDSILPEIVELADCSISFFGHSMGALIAFEVAHRLEKDYNIIPDTLFLSGHRSPSLQHNRKFLHDLSPEELIKHLHTIGGIEHSQNISLDLMRPFLPTLI